VEKEISGSVRPAGCNQHGLDDRLLPSIVAVAQTRVVSGSAHLRSRIARIMPTCYLHGRGPV
jgi:hypothetical protein